MNLWTWCMLALIGVVFLAAPAAMAAEGEGAEEAAHGDEGGFLLFKDQGAAWLGGANRQFFRQDQRIEVT